MPEIRPTLLSLACVLAMGCTAQDDLPPLPDTGEPGTYRVSFEHNSETRTAVVHVPASYSPGDAALVLNFHGFGGTSDSQLAWADMRALSDLDGHLVAYPQGTELDGAPHWNSALPGPDNKSSADDLGFAQELVDHIDTAYPIDRDRVSAVGYSNGGMFAFALACHQSDLVAAVGSVSGGMMDSHEADCSATHPTSVITLHGTRDDVLSYDGGGGMVAAEDALAFWADHNGITGAPAEASDGSIDQLLYPTGDGGSAVHHYRYQGGGHVWFDDTYQGSDASALVWDFLTAFDTSGAL